MRSITTDGAFRVVAAITTNTANALWLNEGIERAAHTQLAQLLTFAPILRETTHPGRRVQLVWKAPQLTLVADAMADGANRGVAYRADTATPVLSVNYTLPNGHLHQGTVALDGVTDAATVIMTYMHQSEQSVTMAAAAAVPHPSGHGWARVGGYLIQVLAEATPEKTVSLLQHLELLPAFADMLASADDANDIVRAVLLGASYQELARSELRFGCTCSTERVLLGMLSLAEPEVDALLVGETLQVRCDGCGKQYAITPETLAAARASSGRNRPSN